jgi:uncharacterized protein
MKIAIVGAGIAGLSAAHALGRQADVTLFEAARGLGGHTDTHAILAGGRTYRVDSGFSVYNETDCPEFSGWLSELGVAVRAAEVSLSVSDNLSGLHYGTGSLSALFCQRRNLASPRFLRMLIELRRFHAEAQTLTIDDAVTVGQFLGRGGYGAAFVEDHLAPLCAALWALPWSAAVHMPVVDVIASLADHPLLPDRARPRWRVIDGGASSYLSAFTARFPGRVAIADGVVAIARRPGHVTVTSRSGRHTFDAVVLACHSDQALALLQDPSIPERDILGAIDFQETRVVVHSDPAVMPVRRSTWSSWNAVRDEHNESEYQITYWANRLQSLAGNQPFFVTVNPARKLANVWSERRYAHPLLTDGARRAQRRIDEISGVANTWYCGAYWRSGRHEDGFASGTLVARALREGLSRAA